MDNQLFLDFLVKNRTTQPRILVVGDPMIDEYYDVRVDRISPEIPTAIMTSTSDKCIKKPGGAANVAYQLKNFNADVRLACIMSGKDYAFFESTHTFKSHAIVGDDVHIPIKRRFISNGFQAKRWDIEDKQYGMSEEYFQSYFDLFVASLKNMEFDYDIVILSDYDKGLFKHSLYDVFKDKLTIVDPKKGPLSKWNGFKIIKPNEAEAKALTGKDSWQEQCNEIVRVTNCDTVIITRGGRGFAGFHKGNLFEYVPETKVQVESVVGAGDCFAAILALGITQGLHPKDAGTIACHAATMYVQNRLNRPIVPGELSPTKIITPGDLLKRDFSLVFTNGCFDLIHAGHLSTLRFAKSKGDKLVVALNSDESVRQLKGDKRPIIPLQQRMELMAALDCVDFVCSFDEATPYEAIKACMPDVLCKGSDYTTDNIIGSDLVKEVARGPFVEGLSTSNIVQKIQS